MKTYDNAGYIDYEQFLLVAQMPAFQMLRALQATNRPRNLLQVEASAELYFGETLRRDTEQSVGLMSIEQSRKFSGSCHHLNLPFSFLPKLTNLLLNNSSEHFSMELYQGCIASMQRFVAMTVMVSSFLICGIGC